MYAKYIDHTLLKPDATGEEIEKLCQEAKQYQFASVCINPQWVKYAANMVQGSAVKVCTVIGFPLGATSTQGKVFEAQQAVKDGATEIDMVIAIGSLKEGDSDYVANDIRQVVEAVAGKAIVKVIFETCILTKKEIILACQLSVQAGAHFVKTSTGFSKGGATMADVQLMKEVVEENAEVKASGGIRSLDELKDMLMAGATRIGTSSGVKFLENETVEGAY